MRVGLPAIPDPLDVSLNWPRLGRLLPFVFLLCCVAPLANAQTASSDSRANWTSVQGLKKGTTIRIKTLDHHKVRCVVGSVDAETITCGGGTFPEEKIESIKTSHRLRSTLVGLGVGSVVAIIVTAIADTCRSNAFLGCLGTAIVAGLIDTVAIIATPIVFGLCDVTARTVYRKPEAVH